MSRPLVEEVPSLGFHRNIILAGNPIETGDKLLKV
jgi:hypothetical protein